MADKRDEIRKAVACLKEGGIILYPTDTIWGLGCDATNSAAVEKLNKLKARPADKSLIILLDNDSRLSRYVKDIPDVAWDLVDNQNKPLTIIYPKGYNLAKNVMPEDESIAVRIVKEGFCHDLLRAFGKPLVSTSANFSGEASAHTFSEISDKLVASVDYAIDFEREKKNSKASSIIKIEMSGKFEIIRK